MRTKFGPISTGHLRLRLSKRPHPKLRNQTQKQQQKMLPNYSQKSE